MRPEQELEQYLKHLVFPGADSLAIEEISEGNINHVFRVTDPRTQDSVIVKRADRVSRISPEIRLSVTRGRREAAYLRLFQGVVPQALPALYDYNAALRLIVMEDLRRDFTVLRTALLQKRSLPFLGTELAEYIAKTALATSDFLLSHPKKKKLQTEFSNPELCSLTEQLVFTAPYRETRGNSISRENETIANDLLQKDPRLAARVAALKFRFMNAPQALIHGDLHFGSLFVSGSRLVVFDPEFCFFGPIGYDLGNVLAHFIIEILYTGLDPEPQPEGFLPLLQTAMNDTLTGFASAFLKGAKTRCADPALASPVFQRAFVASVLADSLGYAGTECIRRTVGIAKVPELERLPHDRRVTLERRLLKTGAALIRRGDRCRTAAAAAKLISQTLEN